MWHKKNILPDYVCSQDKLMNGEDNPRNVAQEEHGYNAAKHKGKICFSSAGFSCSHVGVPGK